MTDLGFKAWANRPLELHDVAVPWVAGVAWLATGMNLRVGAAGLVLTTASGTVTAVRRRHRRPTVATPEPVGQSPSLIRPTPVENPE